MAEAGRPLREVDGAARDVARGLLAGARRAALGVLDPETGGPLVSRIALANLEGPVSLISDLALHARALAADRRASLLVGEVLDKGDPLTHPRMTLVTRAEVLPDKGLRAPYLAAHPKAKLYVDFADFRFVRFHVLEAHLNGGFGKAYRLGPADLGLG